MANLHRLDSVRADTMPLDVAARRSGFSKSMLYEHFKAGDLPFPVLQIGHVVRVPIAPFEQWLTGGPAVTGEPERAVEAGA
jgi:hypothetical protein